MRRRWIATVLVAGISLLGAQAANATTTTVNCSQLQNALNSAGNGDVIKLNALCVNQSFSFSNSNSFTLEGASTNSNGTPKDGFNGDSNDSTILGSNSPVSITVQNLLFENSNIDAGDGSALFLLGAVTLHNDTFRDNSNASCGGCPGGAVYIQTSNDTSPITITGSRFTGNTGDDGGAVYLDSSGAISITHNTFTGNSVTDSSGAIAPFGGALDVESSRSTSSKPVTVSHNTFGGTASGAGNSAPGWGGAMYASLAGGTGSGPTQTLTLNNNRFIDNHLTGASSTDHLGGALAFFPKPGQYGFDVMQAGNLFQGNVVGGTNSSPSSDLAGGGAEWGTGTSILSTADTFLNNSVTEASTHPAPEGGAVGVIGYLASIHAQNDTPLSSTFNGRDDLFMGNSVTQPDGWGGAIYTGIISPPVNNCDYTTCPPSHLKLYDSTLTDNAVDSTTGEGAAAWGSPKDTLTMDNSIVFGNHGVAGAPEIFGYSKPTYSHDDACTTSGGSTPLPGPGDICSDPKLQSSGAETSSSPTVDRGSNSLVPSGLTKDIAGHPRIARGRASHCHAIVDMGAFETKTVTATAKCHTHPVPVDVTPPKINHDAKAGQTLTCEHGFWTHHPTGYKYQWRRDGKPIRGATNKTYVVTPQDEGQHLSCTVRAYNRNGTGKPATSAAVSVTKPAPTKKPKHHHHHRRGFTG